MTVAPAPDEIGFIEDALARHAGRIGRDEIVLYAGTNLMSPRAEAALASPLGLMPAMGRGPLREQPGVEEVVAIEAAAEAHANRLFAAGWTELRLASCTIANLAVYAAICGRDGRIAATPRRAGGHVSHHAPGPPGLLGLHVIDLPFAADTQMPDDAASAALILRERPRLVVLGASFMPRLYRFDRIREAASSVGAVVFFDIAHVAGLVAGGAVPNPLDLGADLMSASTYKSLGGPPGGMILGRDGTLEDRIRSVAYPALTSNYDASRVAALAISLAESKQQARPYAQAMLANARALEAELDRLGLRRIPSETHHIGLPLGAEGEARAASARLREAGILCGVSAMAAPGISHGLRIGTQLLTRRGFAPEDMAPLAGLVAGALRSDAPAGFRDAVTRLAQSRRGIEFCSA